MIERVGLAIYRGRRFAASIFLTYVVSSAAGIAMVHAGNRFALARRDTIVHAAVTSDQTSIAYASGHRGVALVRDAAGNLLFAAVPQTLGGLGVALPYFSVAYQGWVGGIVSVDGNHRSRLRTPRTASYYVLVLLLQFIPFSLCIGAGVRCGVELYRHNTAIGWRFWQYRLPRQCMTDLGYAFAVAVPLFVAASAFEFLSPWNQ